MKNSLQFGKIILVMVLFALVSCNNRSTYNGVDDLVNEVLVNTKAITVEQLMHKIDNGEMILLLDVREPAEFNAGYIPGAVNIPRGVLEFKIANEAYWEKEMLYMPLKEDEIIVYCKKGKRSILAAGVLQKLGYTNVSYVTGGWKKWETTYPLIYEKNLDKNAHEDAEEAGGC